MTTKTKLFNIRITEEKHKKFKAFAEEHELSMGAILNNYIQSLLDGNDTPIGFDDGRKINKWEDPAASVRGQYRKGIDF
jgi:hypothetical protein